MRIGSGFDVHQLDSGEGIFLGGVKILCEYRLIAHSDGDVLLHALCDALLGSVALGDIGKHFPDTDAQYAGADSRELLRHCYKLLVDKGYQLGNADITVMAQKPKLAPHIMAIRNQIADDLAVDVEDISVKATTTEKLGFTGRGEGIAVQATVLVAPLVTPVETPLAEAQ